MTFAENLDGAAREVMTSAVDGNPNWAAAIRLAGQVMRPDSGVPTLAAVLALWHVLCATIASMRMAGYPEDAAATAAFLVGPLMAENIEIIAAEMERLSGTTH